MGPGHTTAFQAQASPTSAVNEALRPIPSSPGEQGWGTRPLAPALTMQRMHQPRVPPPLALLLQEEVQEQHQGVPNWQGQLVLVDQGVASRGLLPEHPLQHQGQ